MGWDIPSKIRVFGKSRGKKPSGRHATWVKPKKKKPQTMDSYLKELQKRQEKWKKIW